MCRQNGTFAKILIEIERQGIRLQEKIILEKKEITSLLVNAISVKMLFSFPRNFVIKSGNAAWIQVIYVSLLALILFFITTKIYQKAGSKDILTIAEETGGKALKIAIGILLILVLGINVAANMRLFPETVNGILLPETPIEFILLLFGVCIAIGAYMGLESIARIHAIFLPVAGLFLVAFLILIVPQISVTNLFPIFGTGTYNIFVSGLEELRLFGDIIILNILLPFCKDRKAAVKSGYRAILISGGISLIITLSYCLTFPYPSSTEFVTPVYMMTRLLRIGRYFQRLEAFFEFVWSIALLLYASLYLFAICHVWQKCFNLRYYRPVIFPVVTLMVLLPLIPASVIKPYEQITVWQALTYALAFVLPVLGGILYRIKTKRSHHDAQKN